MVEHTTRGFSTRPHHTILQLALYNPVVVGMQESRDDAYQRHVGPFLGILGCQFLINTDAKCLPGAKPFLLKHTCVAYSDER